MIKRPGHRYTRKLKGGEFVAKGSYGCVYKKPPLKCSNEATRRNNSYVTKLMEKHDAEEEAAQSLLIRHLDPTEKYFVSAEKQCNLNIDDVKPENGINKCTIRDIQSAMTKKQPEKVQLLVYKNAGTDVHRVSLGVEDYVPFYESLTNLFDGLEFFHSKGVIHHDIKSDNLISFKNDDGTFLTRFIDVGFICSFLPIEDSKEIEKLAVEFRNCRSFSIFDKKARSYGPFYEFFFAFDYKSKPRLQKAVEGESYESQYNDWCENVTQYLRSNDPFTEEDEKTPAIPYEAMIEGLVETWGPKINDSFVIHRVSKNLDHFKFMLNLTSKADIFSFGLVFGKLQEKFIPHKVEKKGGVLQVFVPRTTKLKDQGAPDVFIPVENLELYGVGAEEAKWHGSVAEKITMPLHNLMVKMSPLNPSKAPTLKDAKADYETILEAVRDLYTPAQVYKGLKAVDEYPDLVAPAGLTPAAKPATPAPASVKPAAPKPVPEESKSATLKTAEKKRLKKKKKEYKMFKEEAEEELEELHADLKKYKEHQKEVEGKLDKAQQDKLPADVIAMFKVALAKFKSMEATAVARRVELEDELVEKKVAYEAFKQSLKAK